jgi:hypothetical protein
MMSQSPTMPVNATSGGPTFSLATLFLVMTIVSVWLCCFTLDRLLAMLICVPLGFALLRTRRAIKVRARAGSPTPSGRKVKTFVTSFYLGIVICLLCVVVAAISVGFLTICMDIFDKYSEKPNSHSFWIVMAGFVGMVLTVLAAQITTLHFVWSTWPRPPDALNEEFY